MGRLRVIDGGLRFANRGEPAAHADTSEDELESATELTFDSFDDDEERTVANAPVFDDVVAPAPVVPVARASAPMPPVPRARASAPIVPAPVARPSAPIVARPSAPIVEVPIARPSAPYVEAPVTRPSAPYVEAPVARPSAPYVEAPVARPSAPYVEPPVIEPSVPPVSGSDAPPAPAPPVKRPEAPRRRRWLAIVVPTLIAAVAVGGVELGWTLATRESAPATTPTTTTTAPWTTPPLPAPTPPPAPAPPTPTMTTPPPTTTPTTTPAPTEPVAAPPVVATPKPRSVPAEITSLSHPAIETIAAPSGGTIVDVNVATAREVKAGDTLFTIRPPQSAKLKALARRVAELEELAIEDAASYKPFLARARRDYERARTGQLVTVKATATGLVVSKVKPGDTVAASDPIADLVDGRTRVAVGVVAGDVPTASWSCVIASSDARHTAACKIQTTEVLPDGQGTRVQVEVVTAGTPWLDDPNQRARIVVEPLAH